MLNKVSFDWFSFTLKGKSLDKVMSDLGLCPDDFEVRGFGRFGYRSMITHIVYDICIMFDGTDDMGIHVVVSGGSIRFFMNCFMSVNGKKTPFDTYATDIYDDEFKHFCAYVLKYGSFSRVDVNIDTDIEFMNPYHIRDLAHDGKMISLYRSWKMYENSDGSGTFYLGKRNSPTFIRIYDKAKEQGDFESVLYRFEVQFNKAADNFMMNFMEKGLASAFSSFVDRQLRFVSSGDYHESACEEWLSFMDLIVKSCVVPYTNYIEKKRKTALNSLLHMFTQYGSIIDTFFTDFGDLDDFIEFMYKSSSAPPDDPTQLYNFVESKGWNMA